MIYKVIEDLRQAMEGLLEPEEVEETVATVEVRETFKASRVGTIAGCMVTDGTVTPRREDPPGARRHDHLRRPDRLAAPLQGRRARGHPGMECGIVLENFPDVKEGDVLEVYEIRQVEREL